MEVKRPTKGELDEIRSVADQGGFLSRPPRSYLHALLAEIDALTAERNERVLMCAALRKERDQLRRTMGLHAGDVTSAYNEGRCDAEADREGELKAFRAGMEYGYALCSTDDGGGNFPAGARQGYLAEFREGEIERAWGDWAHSQGER